jgi:hypothetical protein
MRKTRKNERASKKSAKGWRRNNIIFSRHGNSDHIGITDPIASGHIPEIAETGMDDGSRGEETQMIGNTRVRRGRGGKIDQLRRRLYHHIINHKVSLLVHRSSSLMYRHLSHSISHRLCQSYNKLSNRMGSSRTLKILNMDGRIMEPPRRRRINSKDIRQQGGRHIGSRHNGQKPRMMRIEEDGHDQR